VALGEVGWVALGEVGWVALGERDSDDELNP